MGGDSDLAPMTEEQSALLLERVLSFRRSLPDPTARDIHDAMADADPAIAEWATPNRVKKINTKLNKECKTKPERDMYEPDETDGPLVLDELPSWPEDQPLHIHLAARGDSRIFRPGEHHLADPDARPSSVALGYRRTLAAVAKLHDDKRRMWRLRDADDTSELAVVCTAVRARRDEKNGAATRAVLCVEYHRGPPRSGAHKRAVAAKMAEHAGAIGELVATSEEQDVWVAHLERNRYYEDKYAGEGGGAAAEEGKMLASYVVTPAPEWFR